MDGVENEIEPKADLDNNQKIVLSAKGSTVETTGLDTLLILLRTLMSYNLEIAATDDVSKAFDQTAWMDFGWSMKKDHLWKNTLTKKILRVDNIWFEAFRKHKWTLESLLQEECTKGLIEENPDFRLFATHSLCRDNSKEEEFLGVIPTPPDILKVLNATTWWNGEVPLQDHVSSLFHPRIEGGIQYQHFSEKAMFIRIGFEKKQASVQAHKEIRTFKIEEDTIRQGDDGRWFVGKQQSIYALSTVIRLADSTGEHPVCDEIRPYWKDGTEVTPMITLEGQFEKNILREAKKEFKRTSAIWSMDNPGRYMMFYYRIDAEPDAIPADHKCLQLNAEEFLERTTLGWTGVAANPSTPVDPSEADQMSRKETPSTATQSAAESKTPTGPKIKTEEGTMAELRETGRLDAGGDNANEDRLMYEGNLASVKDEIKSETD